MRRDRSFNKLLCNPAWSLWAAFLAACALSACVRRAPIAPPAPPAVPPLGAVTGLRVLLVWDAPVDLDLYLTDPSTETLYFGNTPPRSGARLSNDVHCADVPGTAPPFMEVAYLKEPRAGRYRVGVDFIDACTTRLSKAKKPVAFRIAVEVGGARREIPAIARLEQFQPIVLEFELQRQRTGEALTLKEEAQP